MKTNVLKTVLLFGLLFSVLLVPASTEAADYEQISSFDVQIEVNIDSSIIVKETILYDFGNYDRHGIFRDIPISYKARGGNYRLRLSDISVTNENGNIYNYEISYPGKYIRLKIGDADTYVSGERTYVITYVVRRALNYFDSHDELYWNVTGDEWDVPILSASANVRFPDKIANGLVQAECFAGYYGNNYPCDGITEHQVKGGDISEVSFRSSDLDIYEGLTIVVGMPKGEVTPPTIYERIIDYIRDNGILFLPIFILGLMIYLWRAKGKDPEGRGTIVAHYDAPNNLTAAEVGTIIDEKVQRKDISAQIIQFAVNGNLKIAKGEKKDDYTFIKLEDGKILKSKFEKDLFIALFGKDKTVELSKLKNSFYKDYALITNKLYKETVENKYFPKNPKNVRSAYNGFGVLLFIVGFATGFLGAFYSLAFITSGIIVMIFSMFMPAKTLKGVHAREHILGLKKYLSVAEKDRIKFHNAPEKNPDHFDRLLPYAMVLGVEKEWANQFEDIYTQPPAWYEGPVGSHFGALYLVNSLGSFQSSANSTLTSRPSSSASSGGSGFSGGGFSGGGFGGGGGGSW